MLSDEEKLQSAKLYVALMDTEAEGRIFNIVKLLDHGANINQKFLNDSNYTPLHIAVLKKDLEIVDLLLKRGAKTTIKNNEGMTALDTAGELDPDVGKDIVELLETHETELQQENDEVNKSTLIVTNKENSQECLYLKRSGTSGIEGQLYETKLITLILIRSFIKEYDELYLGTNLEGVGAFDDICVRYKQNNTEVVVFLQAKHRNEVTKGKIKPIDLWKTTGDFSFYKYFESYKMVKDIFETSKKDDKIFNGNYKDIKNYFVFYTPAGNEMNVKKTFETTSTDNTVKYLIESGEHSDIFQYKYTDEEVDLLSKSVLVEQIKCLGKTLFDYIKKNKFDMMLSDNYIRRYNVVLAQRVINVSDVNAAGHRIGKFRDEFFDNDDELIVTLKETIYNEAVKAVKCNKKIIEELVQAVVLEPTVNSITQLMQNILIDYDDQNYILVVNNENVQNLAKKLSEIKIKYNVYNEAYNMAIKQKLKPLCIKLPSLFGNIDIAVSGKRGVKRLQHLAGKLENFLSKFKDNKVIINNESIGPDKIIDAGVMELNGGLASAVGNLLILSEDDNSLKFNMNDISLGKYSKLLLQLLNDKINDLDAYRLKIDIEGWPKLSLKTDEKDKMLAKDFFDKLWFYTNQDKEYGVETHSKEILEDYCITNKQGTVSNIRYDVIYLKIHDEVQKWWMTEGESHYLTNNRHFFDDILKEFLEKSLLIILSSVFMTRMKSHNVEFNKESVQSLSIQLESDYTVVVTEVVTLTAIKLIQHFQNLKNYAFIDIDSPLLRSRRDRNVLKVEIKSKKLQTLIIIYEDISDSKSELFQYLIKETTSKQLIIVTNTISCQKLVELLSGTSLKPKKVTDEGIELIDLHPESQKMVLKNKFMFQGIEICVDSIITNEENKYLIKPFILSKLINNEIVKVGKTLSNPNYEEIKEYYIDRRLIDRSKQEIIIKTFEEINSIVVLAGAPGAGKSTFVTHMSIVTKEQNPTLWIERINLLDYTKEFHRWQENKTDIDYIEALKFVCKTAITKIITRYNINYEFDQIIFDLEIVNGELILRNSEIEDNTLSFELEMFLHFYNKGNTILIFDGFDEICPHYNYELTTLLKCFVTKTSAVNSSVEYNKQRLWITSRSYNNIITILKSEFGDPYELAAFNVSELQMCMKIFFKINLNLNKLNNDQLAKVTEFLKYTIREHTYLKDDTNNKKDSLFAILYLTALHYFQDEKEYVQFSEEKISIVNKWRKPIKSIPEPNELHIEDFQEQDETITPIHLYIALNYFSNEILNTNTDSEWNWKQNKSSFYKYFLETKMKKIRFGQKNQMDIYNPDVKSTYDKEFKEFLEKHKKIAFYSEFVNALNEILIQSEIDETKKIIKEFEAGEEKTGVVDYIINGVPKFIHLTFQEYLAAEYIVDLLKTKPEEDQLNVWNFILKQIRIGTLEFFCCHFENDEELQEMNLSDDIKRLFLTKSDNEDDETFMNNNMFVDMSMLVMDLPQTAIFFIKAIIDSVHEDNFKDFMKYIGPGSEHFHHMIIQPWDDIICFILDAIRDIDPSALATLICDDEVVDCSKMSNEEIFELYQSAAPEL